MSYEVAISGCYSSLAAGDVRAQRSSAVRARWLTSRLQTDYSLRTTQVSGVNILTLLCWAGNGSSNSTRKLTNVCS